MKVNKKTFFVWINKQKKQGGNFLCWFILNIQNLKCLIILHISLIWNILNFAMCQPISTLGKYGAYEKLHVANGKAPNMHLGCAFFFPFGGGVYEPYRHNHVW
jgi:hypothetical protein